MASLLYSICGKSAGTPSGEYLIEGVLTQDLPYTLPARCPGRHLIGVVFTQYSVYTFARENPSA